jgi:hypothetical protein
VICKHLYYKNRRTTKKSQWGSPEKEVRQTIPKVKLNRDAPLNEAAKRFYHFFRAGKSKAQICKLMGYSDATDCNRLKAPEFFTLRELRILYKEAQLPDEEFMKMIREEK